MERVKQVILFSSVLALVASSPIEFGSQVKSPLGKNRVRRQEDVRNCEDPDNPIYPDTTVITTEHLQRLRAEMEKNDIHAYIIPSEDAHQSEYIAEADQRRTFISGFDGSAGLGIVTTDKAAMWVDGRYFLQAKLQLDCQWISMEIGEDGVPEPEDWLVDGSDDGAGLPDSDAKVGFDPTLLSISAYFTYDETFKNSGRNTTLKSITENLIDTVWVDMKGAKPAYPGDDLLILNETYTGRSWEKKIFDASSEYDTIRELMALKEADALVVHKLDEIAWIFNMRGADIPFNPMFISYAIIETDNIRLYMWNPAVRVKDDIREHLKLDGCNPSSQCIQLIDYTNFLDDLTDLGTSGSKVWHSDYASYAIYERIPEDNRIMEASPILLMKARKNPTELDGLRQACWKDSVSLCELFGWIQEMVDNMTPEQEENGDIEYLSELVVEAKAIEFRERWAEFTGLSFNSISAFADHGAIIHYSSSETTDVPITKKGTYMLDSGSQYLDGTTDITRTMHYGTPDPFEKEAYTRVLMGHIDLVNTNFRTGVYGRDIDAIAREPLWSNGLDYRHGTGHGIGHFLNVHEGPARISIGYRSSEKPMETGMFFSDEPGYYEDGAFGIRLENDMIVVDAVTDHKFSTYEYMTFEMLSLVPFDPNLIDYTLLSPAQIDYYNKYNDRIRTEIGPYLTERGRKWMEARTMKVNYEFNVSPNHASTIALSGMVAIASVILAHFLKM